MKAVAYCRYSSDNQRAESIDAQVRAITDYCAKNDIDLIKTYIDEAKSATSDDRTNFLDMIKDSHGRIFDMVIVHKLDRFARNRYDSAFYKKKLKDNGVRIVSVLEQLDDSPESVILESVLEGMAEYYSLNLAREVRKGLKETALACRHTGGIPPLGYDIGEDKTYIINESEAQTVSDIFHMYVEGISYDTMADRLREKGARTKLGREFRRNSIHDILKNEKYTGTYIYNRTVSSVNGKRNNHASKSEDEIIRIPGGMPPIISRELFDFVQRALKDRQHTKGRNSAKKVYLLSGIIKCGKCGAPMSGATRVGGRNKTKNSYYECSNRKRTKACDMKSIPQERIESFILTLVEESVLSKEGMASLAENITSYLKSQKSSSKDGIKTLEKDLRETTKKIDGFMAAIADGLYTHAMKDSIERLEFQKEYILGEIERIGNTGKYAFTKAQIIGYFKHDLAALKSERPDEIQRIIRSYVRSVYAEPERVSVDSVVTFVGGAGSLHAKVTILAPMPQFRSPKAPQNNYRISVTCR